MYSIGILAAAASLNNIMAIDTEMRKYCNVTYLPYSSIEHLQYVYRQNVERFDALLFGGSYTYHIIKDQVGHIARPSAFFTIADRDYYRLIAQLAIQQPGVDFSRVYFDRPEIPVNFASIFGREDLPLVDDEDDPSISYQDYWALTCQRYQKVWASGTVDLIVTRLGSMETQLQQANIRYRLLLPSPESMLDTFFGLLTQLKEAAPADTSACVGLVTPRRAADGGSLDALAQEVEQCNRQLGEIFLIYRHGERLELTTNTNTLRELTRQYAICPLLAFLETRISFPVSIGWGCAGNVVDAHRNAGRALKEAMKQSGFASYTVTDDSYVIGPMAAELGPLFSCAGKGGFSGGAQHNALPKAHAEKIRAALTQKGDYTLSAPELADILQLTTRTAARLLIQLEAAGAAVAHYRRNISQRGRPVKYYRIDINALY